MDSKSLPFLLRLVAATITAQQNKMLIAELAHTRTQLQLCMEELGPNHRFRFTDAWRKHLARTGAAVGWKRLAEIALVAKASTIRRWYGLMRAGKLGIKRSTVGRPRVDPEVESVVLRMAKENSLWGQFRISGELWKLGIRLCARTVAAILNRHGLKPAPERTVDYSWKRFVTDHMDHLVATDFFSVNVWSWLGKQTYDVLFVIHLKTRRVEVLGVTQHANEHFMEQVARNITAEDTGWLKNIGCRYLIHDRDGKFCGRWKGVLQEAGITLVPTPPRSPNLNAFAERWVRTVKYECIRRMWFLDYGGLCRVLKEFTDHYNTERPHQGKGNNPLSQASPATLVPTQKSLAGFKARHIRCATRCNGAIRHYYRAAT